MLDELARLLDQGDGQAVVDKAEAYFKGKAKHSTHEGLRVAAYAVRAAAGQRAWGKVVVWSEKALAMKVADDEALGWVQLYLGTACLYLGNVYKAETALGNFEKLAARTPALARLVPFGHHSLAMLMRFMRRPDEEAARFRQAAAGFAELGLTHQYLLCRLASAWSHLLQGLADQGHAELLTLQHEVTGSSDPEVQMNFLLAEALHRSLVGRLAESDQMCHELLLRDPTVSMAADINWLLGCNARARGEQTVAFRYASEAEKLALQDFWPLQMERIEALKRVAVAN